MVLVSRRDGTRPHHGYERPSRPRASCPEFSLRAPSADCPPSRFGPSYGTRFPSSSASSRRQRDTELRIGAAEQVVDGTRRDAELLRDLPTCAPICRELAHLPLPATQVICRTNAGQGRCPWLVATFDERARTVARRERARFSPGAAMGRCRRSERLGGEQVERKVGEASRRRRRAPFRHRTQARGHARRTRRRERHRPCRQPPRGGPRLPPGDRSGRDRGARTPRTSAGSGPLPDRQPCEPARPQPSRHRERRAPTLSRVRCRRRRCCRGSSCSRLARRCASSAPSTSPASAHAMARYADIGRAYPRSSEPISTVPSRNVLTARRGRPRTKAITPRTRHQPTRG